MTIKRRLSREISEDGPVPKVFKSSDDQEQQENERLARLKLFLEKNQNLRQLAWQTNFIDEFHDELTSSSTSTNFNLFARCLEMSTRIFDLRVNLLYEDIIKMRTTLFRRNTRDVRKEHRTEVEERVAEINVRRKRPARKSFITQNVATLNKPLQTHAALDLFFAKLSKSIEHNSSKMLLNNLLSSDARYSIPGQEKLFWDSSNDYKQNEIACSDQFIVKDVTIDSRSDIRKSFKNYEISNEPYEGEIIETILILDSDEEMEDHSSYATKPYEIEITEKIYTTDEEMGSNKSYSKQTQDSGYMSDFSLNNSMQSSFVIDPYSEIEDSLNPLKFSFDDNSTQDSMLLEDTAVSEMEMMPTTTEKFEYSYQSIDDEDVELSLMTVPSHWKLLSSIRKLKESTPKTKKETKISRRRLFYSEEVSYESVIKSAKKTSEILFTNPGKLKLQTMKDAKKQNQYIDYLLPSDMLDSFFIAPEFDVNMPICDTLMPVSIQNCDNNQNEPIIDYDLPFEYDSNLHVDEPPTILNEPLIYNDYRSSNFISIKKQKIINMKLVKQTTVSVVESEYILNESPTLFSTVSTRSAKLLKEFNENASAAVIFQAILHNANDGKIEIASTFNNLSDFGIRIKQD